MMQTQINFMMSVDKEKISEKIRRHRIDTLCTFKKRYEMQKQTKICFFNEKSFYGSWN